MWEETAAPRVRPPPWPQAEANAKAKLAAAEAEVQKVGGGCMAAWCAGFLFVGAWLGGRAGRLAALAPCP